MQTGRGTTEVLVKPGQFIFGRHSASKELGMNGTTIWKRMQKLKKLGNVDIKSDSQYSLITLLNWHCYQHDNLKSDTDSDRQVTTKCQASDTNNNVENEKNEIYICSFDSFWTEYPKKQNKKAAKKLWIDKIQPGNNTFEEMMAGLRRAKDSEQWKKDKGKFIPLPTSWLNGRRWEDEHVEQEENKRVWL